MIALLASIAGLQGLGAGMLRLETKSTKGDDRLSMIGFTD
jgi:hypothetical protein